MSGNFYIIATFRPKCAPLHALLIDNKHQHLYGSERFVIPCSWATPYISMSVFCTLVSYFKLQETKIFFCYLMVSALLGENVHYITKKIHAMTFQPSVFRMEKVLYIISICVQTCIRTYTDMDRCSSPNASWSLVPYTDTGKQILWHGYRGVA